MRLIHLSTFRFLMVYLTISSAFVLPRHTDDEPEKPKQVDPSLSTEISNGDGAGLGESFAMLGRQITAQRSPRTSLQKAFLKAMEGIENERLVVLLCIVNQRKLFLSRFNHPKLSYEEDLKVEIKGISQCRGKRVPAIAAKIEQELEERLKQEAAGGGAAAQNVDNQEIDSTVDPDGDTSQNNQFDVGLAAANLGVGGGLTWGALQVAGDMGNTMLHNLAPE